MLPLARLPPVLLQYWTAADYLQAQRIRARATVHFERALQAVDVLVGDGMAWHGMCCACCDSLLA